ncbi:MAG: hypothetical protein K2X04_07055 [Burkholderiales bacterium]|nr:hypothetical protein [Burkholderiales bacterium]
MFISRLKNSLANYDRFAEHRINGLKAVFVLELLFGFNYVFGMPNPYFYYFYIPLTAFAAELVGNTLQEKYLFYFFTVMGSVLAVFCFGVFSSYKIFFVFFVFFYSIWLYFTALYFLKSMLVPVPLILSLAAYSMTYGDTNSNFYIALNHSLQTFVAMLLVFAGLFLFPKTYYLSIWRRGFYNALSSMETVTFAISHNRDIDVPIIPGTVIMERYAKMISRRDKYFSVLKITLLSLDLVMAMSYLVSFRKQLRTPYIVVLHKYLVLLKEHCFERKMIFIAEHERSVFQETYELRTLYQLINSWNYLCSQS